MKVGGQWFRGNGMKILFVVILGLVCFMSGYSWIPDNFALSFVRYSSKPLVYLLYGVLAIELVRKVSWADVLGREQRYKWVYVCVLVSALLVLVREPFGFKVTSDEYVIAGQAMNMHFEGTNDFSTSSFQIYGVDTGIQSFVDKRPPAFMGLLSLFHDVFGYRVLNVFILNSILGVVLMGVLARLASGLGSGGKEGLWLSVLALLLVVSLPLFSQNIHGAGFELMNILLILLSACLAYVYLSSRGDKWFLLWILVSLVLFYTRYESVLFVGSVAGVILIKACREKRLPGWPHLLWLPVALVPVLLRNRIFELMPEASWQFQNGENLAFSLGYFIKNLGHAAVYFFDYDRSCSNSYLISYLGIPVLLLFLVRGLVMLLRRQAFKLGDQVFGLYGLVVLVNFLLLLCYHWGTIDTIEASRLALPIILLMGAVLVRFVKIMEVKWERVIPLTVVFSGIYVLFVAIPVASVASASKHNYYASTAQWVVDQVRQMNDPSAFVVTDSPLLLRLHRVPAMYTPDVVSNIEGFKFHLVNESFNAYLVEKLRRDPINGEWMHIKHTDLGGGFVTEEIARVSYKPYHVVVLSRIRSIDDGQGGEAQLLIPPEEQESFKNDPFKYWMSKVYSGMR